MVSLPSPMSYFRPFVVSTILTINAFAQNAAPSTQAPAAPVAAATPAAPELKPLLGPIQLNDGDTFVFLGDSITHQCHYTQYVENFFYTRFPKRRIHFHNAGVGGDRAQDALRRFDEDVAAFKPKYVSVLLGMNDGSYTRYEQGIFDTYQRDMTTLLDRIEATGAKAITITPTMFDARAAKLRGKTSEPRDTYYNGVLSLYGSWLREVAHQRGLGFVDMWSPLNNLTQEARRKDPAFTLIKDAVHPDPAGQFVMAAAFIHDAAPQSSVSHITIEKKGENFASLVKNGQLTDLQASETGVKFTFEANALPWAVLPEAAFGYQLARAGARLSSERIAVRHLKPGKYDLKIDGQVVATFTDTELADGVPLERNEKTPQYQQALRVATLNKKRNDEAMRPLRDFWIKRKSQINAVIEAEAKKGDDLGQKKEEFQKFTQEFNPKVEGFIAKAREFEDQIYAENQPKARKYEITAAAATP